MKHVRPLKHAILTAFLVLLCQTASAQSDCGLSDTLKRVHASSVLLFEHPVGGVMTSNLRRVEAELSFLDIDLVSGAISRRLKREDAITVLRHLQLMTKLVDATQKDQRSHLQSLLFEPANAGIVSAAGPNIAKLGCVSFTSTNETIAQNDSSKTSMGAASGRSIFFQSFKLAQSYAFFIGLATLGIAAWGGNRFISRYLQNQRIRAKRYYLFMYVSFAIGSVNYRGAILDISRLGTKLRHRGTTVIPEKSTIKLLLNGQWHDGKIMWTSDDYCGVKFNTGLSRKDLRAIRAMAEGNAQPNKELTTQDHSEHEDPSGMQNGAPRDAVR